MNIFLKSTLALSVALTLAGCQSERSSLSLESANYYQDKADQIVQNSTPEQVDSALRSAALTMSAELASDATLVNEFARYARTHRLTQQSDEILIEEWLLQNSLQRSSAQASPLAKALNEQPDFRQAVDAVPLFQAEFLNFEKLQSGELPWILAMEYATPDEELEAILGYNGLGETRWFTREDVDNEPVIILGVNEKMEFITHKLENPTDTSFQLKSANEIITLDRVKIKDDRDFGPGEFYYFTVVGDYHSTKIDSTSFKGSNGKEYKNLNKYILDYQPGRCAQRYFGFSMWENDKEMVWNKVPKSIHKEHSCNGQYQITGMTTPSSATFVGKADDHMITVFKHTSSAGNFNNRYVSIDYNQ